MSVQHFIKRHLFQPHELNHMTENLFHYMAMQEGYGVLVLSDSNGMTMLKAHVLNYLERIVLFFVHFSAESILLFEFQRIMRCSC